MSDFSPNPEELYAKSEREATLRDAIAKLRPSIREAFEIHMLQERSLGETATVLWISVAAVEARVFRARAALRRTPPPVRQTAAPSRQRSNGLCENGAAKRACGRLFPGWYAERKLTRTEIPKES